MYKDNKKKGKARGTGGKVRGRRQIIAIALNAAGKSRKSKKVELKIEELDEVKEPLNDWGLRNRNLYLHQKNNVLKMEYQESTKEREYTYGNRKTKVFTNMGILNDKVGSGKTLAVVSLLSRTKIKNEPLEEKYIS